MSSPSTDARVAEIEARVKAVTAGPWRADVRESWDMVVWGVPNPSKADDSHDGAELVMNIGDDIASVGSVCGSEADCHFIAHSREDIPYLLSALREAQEDAERLRAALAACEENLRLVHDATGQVNHNKQMPKYSTFQAWEMAATALGLIGCASNQQGTDQ